MISSRGLVLFGFIKLFRALSSSFKSIFPAAMVLLPHSFRDSTVRSDIECTNCCRKLRLKLLMINENMEGK